MSGVVGFIGAGQMGEPMVRRLVDAGREVVLYARKPEVRERLGQAGAALADSVAEVAARADILILCLFKDAQVTELALGPDGFMANAKPGAVVVSHTTGNVSTLDKIRAEHPSGPTLVDAPVSGTSEDIIAGRLTVMLGGDAAVLDAVEEVLKAYADPILRTGGPGSALNFKLINNVLFAANAQLVAAAIELGTELNIESSALLEAVARSSGRSYALNSVKTLGGREAFEEVAAPFLKKDVAACISAAQDANVELGWLASVVAEGPLNLT